ncbi:unnamed protein product [Polarella glacialis]|uniref:Uncharacterized protein n=1 Tax=Polarella glacialis TaxID=89957 RepID=A0A813I6R3_POLGL|nr:unnamed protein product [Polarella glacialis]
MNQAAVRPPPRIVIAPASDWTEAPHFEGTPFHSPLSSLRTESGQGCISVPPVSLQQAEPQKSRLRICNKRLLSASQSSFSSIDAGTVGTCRLEGAESDDKEVNLDDMPHFCNLAHHFGVLMLWEWLQCTVPSTGLGLSAGWWHTAFRIRRSMLVTLPALPP